MKSQITQLLQEVLTEVGTWCSVSTQHDCKTIVDRVEAEGLEFITLVLPEFGKAFERSLEAGFLYMREFPGFSAYRRFGRAYPLPQFLGGFMQKVFNLETGELLYDADPLAVRAIRQITLFAGKIELECSTERTNSAYQRYIECDEEVAKWEREDSILPKVQRRLPGFDAMGSLLFRELFSRVDLAIFNGEVVPKHGPGATADRLLGNQKYKQCEWTTRLEEYFPFLEMVYSSYRLGLNYDAETDATFLEPGDERPVKVVDVPKTLKTPRIIAEEPTCMQYVQQGILELLTDELNHANHVKGFIDWSDQTPNQRMARSGSIDGSLATLDLSEASDRVSNLLVRRLLRNHPHMLNGVMACRSTRADVRGQIIHLAKFASMGSALCFPIEAMVFLTIVLSTIATELSSPPTRKFLRSMAGRVRVYGDDIVVPAEFAIPVIRSLEAFGLKVNEDKSFWTGRFRESCGKEYFLGTDVSIVRLRSPLPENRKHVHEIVSTVSLRNQLFLAGFVKVVEGLDNMLEKLIPLPIIEPTASCLGRYSYDLPKGERMHPNLHTPLVRAVKVRGSIPVSKLDGAGALMKYFLKRGITPHEENHLIRAGRPVSLTLKYGWYRPY